MGKPDTLAFREVNGWGNPYSFYGRDRVRSDPAIGLDWLTTRAYDPSTGRFISRDVPGRIPLFFSDTRSPTLIRAGRAKEGGHRWTHGDRLSYAQLVGWPHDLALRESGLLVVSKCQRH